VVVIGSHEFSDVHLICELAGFPKSFWLD
jgi:hypothetical protein